MCHSVDFLSLISLSHGNIGKGFGEKQVNGIADISIPDPRRLVDMLAGHSVFSQKTRMICSLGQFTYQSCLLPFNTSYSHSVTIILALNAAPCACTLDSTACHQ